MLKQAHCNTLKALIIGLGLLMLLTIAPWAMAQSSLESPTSGSFESGIGLIRGWVCDASSVDVIIDPGTDNEVRRAAAYPTRRPDTLDRCGDSDNGFGVTINWNNLGDGVHSLRALADGIEFANVNFVVTTLGDPFRTNLSGEFSLSDFPSNGATTLTRWSEAHQNFVIVSNQTIPANPTTPNVPGTALESPTQGSFESGVGLIRGWVCEADAIEIVIDPGPDEIRRAAAYPTRRPDTANNCGDSDNGFGVTINWNNLETGDHTLSALADGVEFANVNFAVTQLGDGFVTGLSGDYPLDNFPVIPQQTTLRWSEPHQNFVISTSTATGDKTALIAALTDQLNPLGVIAADPSNFGSLFGVRTSRSSEGQTTALQSLDWADLDAGLWARLLLGTEGLPDQYLDSQGIEVRFANYTDNSVEVSIFDSTGMLIADPITLSLDLSRLVPLQGLISGLGSASTSTAWSFNNPQKHIISFAEAATLNKFTVELVWTAGIALNEMICQVGTLGFVNQVASAGCDASVVKGFRSLANAPGGALDPLVQRALQFSRQDLDNVPCNAEESSNTCFQEAVAALREIEPEQDSDGGGEPPPAVPSVPASVQASDGLFPDRVNIVWDAVTDATFYEIYRDGSQIGQEASAQFTDFNVTAGTVYGYQVTACNGLGCSERSVSDDGFAEQQNEQFTVIANAGVGGSISPPEQTVNAGATTTFTVTPDAGFLISNVSGCGGSLSGDLYTTGPITADCTVNASFTQQQPDTYVLTLATAGTGAGAVSGDGQYAAGDTVNLLADPNSASTFEGWSPAPCASNFTMPDQDLTCTATFTLRSHAVTATAGTGGSITPTSQTVDHGAFVSFTVTPDITYAIDTVTGCGGSLNGNTYTTAAITAPCTVTANFSQTNPPPGVPNNFQATDGSSTDRVMTTWDSVVSATSYEVYRDGALIGQPTGPRLQDTSVTPGQRYNFAVKACNSAGCSKESLADSGYAELPAPAGASTSCDFSGPGPDGTPVFSWAPVSGAVDLYEIYDSSSASSIGSRWGTTSSTVTRINAQPLRWYRARACNNDTGCGDFSDPVQAPFCIG